MTWGAVLLIAALCLGLRSKEPTRSTRLAFLGIVVVVLAYVYTGLGSLPA